MSGSPDIRAARRALAAGLGLCFGLTLFLDFAMLVIPLYDMQLYDRVLQSRNLDTLTMLSLAALAGLAVYGLLDGLRGLAFGVIADSVARRLHLPVLRAAVARGTETGPAGGVEAVRDVHEVQTFLASGALGTLLDVLCAPLMTIVLFLLHPAFGWLTVSGCVMLVLLGLVTDRVARPGLAAAAAARTRVAVRLAGRLGDPELVDGVGLLPGAAARWQAEEAAVLTMQRRAEDRAHLFATLSRVVRLVLGAAVMVTGALLVLDHSSTPGSLMGANLLANKVLSPFDHLVGTWRHWVLAGAAWQRVRGAVAGQAAHPAARAPDASPLPGLSLTGVGFTPEGAAPVLRDIDLHVPPGTALAVVGANGAGKSTLLRLLVGLAAPTSGHSLLDGVPTLGGPSVGLPSAGRGAAGRDGCGEHLPVRPRDTGGGRGGGGDGRCARDGRPLAAGLRYGGRRRWRRVVRRSGPARRPRPRDVPRAAAAGAGRAGRASGRRGRAGAGRRAGTRPRRRQRHRHRHAPASPAGLRGPCPDAQGRAHRELAAARRVKGRTS